MKSPLRRVTSFLLMAMLPLSLWAEIIHINNGELKALIAEDVTLIDVRRNEEWKQTGVVDGSHPLTFFDKAGNYDAKAWLSDLSSIVPKDQPVILICHAGVRSKVIANWLSNGVGYQKVYNVKKGIEDWIDQGNPTVGLK